MTLDVLDADLMTRCWSSALGYRVDGDHRLPPAGESGPSVWLQPTDAAKTGKNRNHPDLVVPGGDVEAEVARLLGLGATRADVGQRGDEPFVVLRDPEGNEFCLLYR